LLSLKFKVKFLKKSPIKARSHQKEDGAALARKNLVVDVDPVRVKIDTTGKGVQEAETITISTATQSIQIIDTKRIVIEITMTEIGTILNIKITVGTTEDDHVLFK